MRAYTFDTANHDAPILVTANSMSEAFDVMTKNGYKESEILGCRRMVEYCEIIPTQLTTKGGWRKWKKFHSPDETSFILVRRENEVCFGMMCGGYRFIRITAEVRGDGFANALVVDDYFADGDEWMYLDDLKRKEE